MTLARTVRAARRREHRGGLLLVAPAIVFLLLVFFAPIASFAWRSVDNSESSAALPQTRQALLDWDGTDLPPESVYTAFLADVTSQSRNVVAVLARRLNYAEPGLRSAVIALRNIQIDTQRPVATQMMEYNGRWGDHRTWQVIAGESHPVTPYYLLRALDLGLVDGEIVRVINAEGGSFRAIFARTFSISALVSFFCLLLGFPVSYVLATGQGWFSRSIFVAVLLPFWISILVRNLSWIILLQQNGVLNRFLVDNGFIAEPLALIYNRFGIYLAMVHVLLPFFVLPLYSVMLKVDQVQLRAAASLGARPFSVFVNAYLPQVMPGVVAGMVLVFVTSLGFYITPALVGGGGDQMVGFFIALYTNASVNWGMAAALGTLLLVATLVCLGLARRTLGRAGSFR